MSKTLFFSKQNIKKTAIDTDIIINPNKKMKVISLFSGCGGLDFGFLGGFTFLNKYYETNPFEIVYANDINEKAVETYNYNFLHKAECIDIKEKILSTLPAADIVIEGFPCQDFSLSGKRRGLNSERGQLFLEMKSVIQYVKPIAFVAENVDGIRNSKKNDETSALDYIIEEFKSIGYKVTYKVLNAKYFGVPQNRIRVIIIGIRNDINANIEYPKEIYDNDNFITSKDAIDDLWDNLNNNSYFNHSNSDYSKAKFYENKRTQGNKKIEANKPAPTIRAEHHGNIEGHYRTYNEKNPQDITSWRRLTVRECARLQGFSDNFIFPCSATHAYRQVGNAVPPVLAWHIARTLYISINNRNINRR